MTTSIVSGILDSQALKFLAGCRGPCLTIVVPGHHPGAQEGSRRALVHALVRTADEQMMRDKVVASTADLLAPLEEIAQESGVNDGGPPFAIFRSAEVMARYYLADRSWEKPVEKLVIGDHFYLTPFVAEALSLHELFVLGLSKKHLRLFWYGDGKCQEQSLPAGVPASLEAAGGFDQPDHLLETRSAAGPSTGSMRGVHVGTQSDREALPEYLYHFFASVDRGLKPMLRGKPLLLMGVHEEVAAYRRASNYTQILTMDCLGNPDFLTTADVADRAADACRASSERLAEQVLAEYREMPDRGRTLADVPAVLRAASEGRIHRLCVHTDPGRAGPIGDDQVNAAVADLYVGDAR